MDGKTVDILILEPDADAAAPIAAGLPSRITRAFLASEKMMGAVVLR